MKKSFWLLLALVPGWAFAHPEHEVVQNAYLTLTAGEVRLQLDLSPGPEVAGVFVRPLDANGDKRITDAEARAFAQAILRQSKLTLDGAPAAFTLQSVTAPTYDALTSGAATLKVYALARRADGVGAHRLAYENRYAPIESRCIGNVFLQASGGWQYQVTGQEHASAGRKLTVRYTAAQR